MPVSHAERVSRSVWRRGEIRVGVKLRDGQVETCAWCIFAREEEITLAVVAGTEDEVTGDVHHSGPRIELVFHGLLGELTIEKEGSGEDSVRALHLRVFDDVVELGGDGGQRGQIRFVFAGDTHGRDAEFADVGLVFEVVDAGRGDGDGVVLLDDILFPVVKGGDGDVAQHAVEGPDEGLGFGVIEVGLRGADEDVVQVLGEGLWIAGGIVEDLLEIGDLFVEVGGGDGEVVRDGGVGG
jgi:hypothetical protein